MPTSYRLYKLVQGPGPGFPCSAQRSTAHFRAHQPRATKSVRVVPCERARIKSVVVESERHFFAVGLPGGDMTEANHVRTVPLRNWSLRSARTDRTFQLEREKGVRRSFALSVDTSQPHLNTTQDCSEDPTADEVWVFSVTLDGRLRIPELRGQYSVARSRAQMLWCANRIGALSTSSTEVEFCRSTPTEWCAKQINPGRASEPALTFVRFLEGLGAAETESAAGSAVYA